MAQKMKLGGLGSTFTPFNRGRKLLKKVKQYPRNSYWALGRALLSKLVPTTREVIGYYSLPNKELEKQNQSMSPSACALFFLPSP